MDGSILDMRISHTAITIKSISPAKPGEGLRSGWKKWKNPRVHVCKLVYICWRRQSMLKPSSMLGQCGWCRPQQPSQSRLTESCCCSSSSSSGGWAQCVNLGSFKPLAIAAQMEVMRAYTSAICQPAAPAAVQPLPGITQTAELRSSKSGKQTGESRASKVQWGTFGLIYDESSTCCLWIWQWKGTMAVQ